MNLQTELMSASGHLRLAVRGEIDAATASQLEDACRRFAAVTDALVLDFEGFRFLDSSGLNVLLQHASRSSTMILTRPSRSSASSKFAGVAHLFLVSPASTGDRGVSESTEGDRGTGPADDFISDEFAGSGQ